MKFEMLPVQKCRQFLEKFPTITRNCLRRFARLVEQRYVEPKRFYVLGKLEHHIQAEQRHKERRCSAK